jgi:sigma-54 specific flagellar transcriptional regulator A
VCIADLPPRYRPVDWTPAAQPSSETLIATVPALSLLGPALAELEQDPEADPDSALDPQLTDELLEQIPAGFDLRHYLESLEQRLIVRAMESAGGTVAQAARVLGLRRTTLVEKLRKYAMGVSDAVAPES